MKLSRLLTSERSDSHPVAIRKGKTICFSQFRADVAALKVPGVSCRVALFMDDSYDFVVALYALLLARCSVVFLPNAQQETLNKFQATFDILMDESNREVSSVRQWRNLDSDVESLYFYTSGSTGEPKCIVKTLQMIEDEIFTLENTWGWQPGFAVARVYSTVPHYHFYGLIFKLLWPLAIGRAFATPTYGPWEVLIKDLTSAAIIISSPAHLKRLGALEKLNKDLIPLQIFSAGAALSYEVAQETKNILGRLPTEIFGSTETGAIATRQMTDDKVTWSLLEGISVKCNEEDKMSVLSPYVGKDWFITDDLIEMRGGGFYFKGRADSVVKIEGKRVSLSQVQTALEALDFVKEAAVIIIEDDKLAALVVPSEAGAAKLDLMGKFRFSRLLRSELSRSLSSSEIPKIWRCVQQMPLRETGKRNLADIKQLFENAE